MFKRNASDCSLNDNLKHISLNHAFIYASNSSFLHPIRKSRGNKCCSITQSTITLLLEFFQNTKRKFAKISFIGLTWLFLRLSFCLLTRKSAGNQREFGSCLKIQKRQITKKQRNRKTSDQLFITNVDTHLIDL